MVSLEICSTNNNHGRELLGNCFQANANQPPNVEISRRTNTWQERITRLLPPGGFTVVKVQRGFGEDHEPGLDGVHRPSRPRGCLNIYPPRNQTSIVNVIVRNSIEDEEAVDVGGQSAIDEARHFRHPDVINHLICDDSLRLFSVAPPPVGDDEFDSSQSVREAGFNDDGAIHKILVDAIRTNLSM